MKNKFLNIALASIVIIFGSLANFANAGVIEGSDTNINGINFNTYFDEATQLTWLDLDSFDTFGFASFDSIITFLQGTDFRLASAADLNTLYANLPLNSGNAASWFDYANIMGAFTNYGRDLIWGVYEQNINMAGYSWAYLGDSNWNFSSYSNNANANAVNGVGSGNDDLGFYVVSNQVLRTTEVPEPSTLAIFALAIFGLTSRLLKK